LLESFHRRGGYTTAWPRYKRGVYRRLTVCLVGAALLVAASAGARGGAGNGRIGYLRVLGGNEPPDLHLFTVNPDGSGAVDLTPPGYTDIRSFAWSPDGRQVAFSARAGDERDPDLFVMNSGGGAVRRLTDGGCSEWEPTWSPDSRWIAFTRSCSVSEIFRIRADGHGLRAVTRWGTHGSCDAPAWSPRGTLIACDCRPVDKIVLVRPDGRRVRILLRRSFKTVELSPDWSPDGRLIAFGRGAHWPASKPLGIWTIRPNGRGLHRVLARGGDPAFSPDGRWLAFVWFRDETEEVYKAHADGSGTAQVTSSNGVFADEPDWQRAP
jgi:dipeptidyl aminopeptidase/acylaminoacyl peptidase